MLAMHASKLDHTLLEAYSNGVDVDPEPDVVARVGRISINGALNVIDGILVALDVASVGVVQARLAVAMSTEPLVHAEKAFAFLAAGDVGSQIGAARPLSVPSVNEGTGNGDDVL